MDEARERPRREFYKLRYPKEDRPTFQVSSMVYNVTEISEYGLRFRLDYPRKFTSGEIMKGSLKFRDNQTIEIEGKTVSKEKDEIVLELAKGIPAKKIMEEQRYLIKMYPQYFREDGKSKLF